MDVLREVQKILDRAGFNQNPEPRVAAFAATVDEIWSYYNDGFLTVEERIWWLRKVEREVVCVGTTSKKSILTAGVCVHLLHHP